MRYVDIIRNIVYKLLRFTTYDLCHFLYNVVLLVRRDRVRFYQNSRVLSYIRYDNKTIRV